MYTDNLISDRRTVIAGIRQTPYMVEDDGACKAETLIEVAHEGDPYPGWLAIEVPGAEISAEAVGTIEQGTRTITAVMAELAKDGDEVRFALYDNPELTGTPRAAYSSPLKKLRRWKVYVAHDIHMDIGYTDYQEELRLSKWPKQTDEALKYMDKTSDWPADEQFKYHFESSYLLSGSAFRARDADWIGKLKERLASGRLGYASGYMNTSMEAMSTEQLVRYYYYSERHLRDKLGIGPSGVAMMRDNPSMSWANIDIMADMGIRYLYLGFNLNPRTPKVITDAYPRLFYMEGRKPDRKVLTFDGLLYNRDQMQFVPDGNEGIEAPIEETIQAVSDALMNTFQSASYAADAVLEDVTQYWDNGALYPQVMERIRAMNARTDSKGRPYVYPKFINSNVQDFYLYVEERFAGEIPSYRGTIENWWNYGIPADAYSEGAVRQAHDRVPAAETLATFANLLLQDKRYPYGTIADAYDYMMLYDEHSFGPIDPETSEQHIWKRNTALASRNLADALMDGALAGVGKLVPTEGPTIAVINPLGWNRDDIVRVKLSELPERFDIVDAETSASVKYGRGEDGYASFAARNVPGHGYKTYRIVERSDEPIFEASLVLEGNTLENAFYKVKFGPGGDVVSIVDKANGNAELVDQSSPYAMNEFLYILSAKDGFAEISESKVEDAGVSYRVGPVEARMTSVGKSEGTDGVERNVVMYEDLPRIDFVNVVRKTEAPKHPVQDEEAFFTFPLNVPDFKLRNEMPAGNFVPGVDANIDNPDIEQFYTSSTDFYTVNRWIDASDEKGGFGVTLFPLTAPVVQFGGRRSLLYDVDYNTPKPWILSYVYNNKWCTNFIKSQPGPTTFRYTLRSYAGPDWKAGRADQYGWEAFVPLEAVVLAGGQEGVEGFGGTSGSWLAVSRDNVILTTAKPAEANGEGTILRFYESSGEDTDVTVDLGVFRPSSVVSTDLLENDKEQLELNDGKATFAIGKYGWATIRVLYGDAPDRVTGMTAATDATGTLVSWVDQSDSRLAFYEVFRGTEPSFEPGSGYYVGTTSVNRFYDRQVVEGLQTEYFYKARAARGGRKGEASLACRAIRGEISNDTAPSAPANLRVDYAFDSRVSLSWEPSPGGEAEVQGYKIYRNGAELADVPAILNSYLDLAAAKGSSYTYTVMAYNRYGVPSETTNPATAVL